MPDRVHVLVKHADDFNALAADAVKNSVMIDTQLSVAGADMLIGDPASGMFDEHKNGFLQIVQIPVGLRLTPFPKRIKPDVY